MPAPDLASLNQQIRLWAIELGFDAVGFSDIHLDSDQTRLLQWLERGFHGEMDYMQRHGTLRSRPAELHPGTLSVIAVRMNYLPPDAAAPLEVLDDATLGYVSRYALGRDYHKVMRNRLQTLAERIAQSIGPFGYRAFVDSAPVLEKPLARKAGLGWIGKHTNLLCREAGSWFFLGELFTDLPLPPDQPLTDHCGDCRACIDICPTAAIVAPYQLDARRCISYLTIELDGSIPEEFRPLIGNRIYGCDDCQLVCPWNRFARLSELDDFAARHRLDCTSLAELASWDEATFLQHMQGSAIRRIGHARWLRNIAVALGNGPATSDALQTLQTLRQHPSALVREHAGWAQHRLDHHAGQPRIVGKSAGETIPDI